MDVLRGSEKNLSILLLASFLSFVTGFVVGRLFMLIWA